MTAQPDSAGWTPDAYLAFERESDIKHEYFYGDVYPVPREAVEAMANASEAHVLISGNIHAALHTRLQDRSCRVYQSDMLVGLSLADVYAKVEMADDN